MDRAEMRTKINEMMDNADPAIDPVIVERINQIVNDAVAGMPPEDTAEKTKVKERPAVVMLRKLRTQIDAMIANGTKEEETARLNEIYGIIESAVEAEPVPAEDVPEPETHA